jgi:hypothetical protein
MPASNLHLREAGKYRTRTKYEILENGIWKPCKIAKPQPSGWLHYELVDGTNGLKRPGTWRQKGGST